MELLPADLLEITHGSPVPRSSIDGKPLALFIAPHWLPSPLHHSLSLILQHFQDLRLHGLTFVFVAFDRDEEIIESLRRFGRSDELDDRPDEECFRSVLSKLPDGWLAIPFLPLEPRSALVSHFKKGLLTLCFLSPDGRLLSDQGLALLEKWGAEAYPFDDERIDALRREYSERKASQNLQALLVHEGRDYLIRSDDAKAQVKALDLQGKIVALYFSAHWCPPCQRFTPFLASIYNELKLKNQEFEVIFVSSDENEESFDKYFKEMPWLAIPYTDLKGRKLLENWFEVEGIPSLVILDGHGKTIATEGTELLYKYGIDAYPFTEERVEQLRQEEEAVRAAQTLESLLVTEQSDSVLSKSGERVKIASFVGKTVGLYFSGHWCPPCRNFTPILKTVYEELKGRGEEFEVVFVSSDTDQESFDEYYDSMPWLALPFGDERGSSLAKYFDIDGIPTLIVIGTDGKTLTTDGCALISSHRADAFPFTYDRIAELQKHKDGKAANLPKEITSSRHAHKLTLERDVYGNGQCSCDHCGEQGSSWVYHCDECGFDLHPDCVGEVVKQDVDLDAAPTPDGYVCDGDVCQKV